MSDNMEEFLKNIFGVVEATTCEHNFIWERWRERLRWEEISLGLLKTVGRLDDRPICISLRIAIINGKRILFWHATSMVVDYEIIAKWLEESVPEGIQNKTDAMNFHIVAHRTEKE